MGLKYKLQKMTEAFNECDRRLKIAHPKAVRWDKLRNWLTNLNNGETVSKTEKIGLQMALRIMDRIEESEK